MQTTLLKTKAYRVMCNETEIMRRTYSQVGIWLGIVNHDYIIFPSLSDIEQKVREIIAEERQFCHGNARAADCKAKADRKNNQVHVTRQGTRVFSVYFHYENNSIQLKLEL